MHEIIGLQEYRFNLTDAHPRYQPVASQSAILDNLGQHYWDAVKVPYQELTDNFERAFYFLANQPTALTLDRKCMLCYSASLCIQIIASYIRGQSLRVALLEPIFDNVSGTLKAEEIDLVPLPEEQLRTIDGYLEKNSVQVVWVTLPNNPTGLLLSENEFRQLVYSCQKYRVMLVIDFCFRFFAASMTWDQYMVLEESGVTYAVIEDTGKTWPTQDLKIGMLQSSSDIYGSLYRYYDNHILNVSPFILRLLTRLIEDTRTRGLDNTIRKIIRTNREIVVDAVKDTILQCQLPQAPVSVAWLKIVDDTIEASKPWAMCKQAAVYLLPGSQFFWHNPALGDRFVRISLVRDVEVMRGAMERLREVLLQIRGQ
jgi:aspartate/methionine/tyrosine aminotransferase